MRRLRDHANGRAPAVFLANGLGHGPAVRPRRARQLSARAGAPGLPECGAAYGMRMARVDEIVDGIYRISTTMGSGEAAFQFNQFLIDDERPALIHTGLHQMYEDVRAAVARSGPTSSAYMVLLHFEADECGGMDRFVEGAPERDAGVQRNERGHQPERMEPSRPRRGPP